MSKCLTTIKVTKEFRDRLNRLAQLQRMSQHAYLDQLLRDAEEKMFWRRMAEASAEEYHRKVEADGDALGGDYSMEEATILIEERGG